MNYLPQFFPSSWTNDHQVFGIPFTNEVSIGLVTRNAGGYSYLQIEEFKELGIEHNTLLASAVAKLDVEFNECEIKVYRIKGGKLAYWSSENDNFTAVRILSGKYVKVLREVFDGDFKFSIPDRDLITCWRTNKEEEDTKLVMETIQDFTGSDYQLSDKVYYADSTKFRL
ncbi:MAG: DUF1444 family protein [Chryseolinea sp.]